MAQRNIFDFRGFDQKLQAARPHTAPHRAGSWHPGPAQEWENAGHEPGILVWRIENFNVVPWPVPQYGKFFDGDSYIVLRTYIERDVKKYDIHFWLGENTSQDESTTAAYKTVELDNRLGGSPVEHREVQGYESALFLSYFKPAVQILHGGIDSGFSHVGPAEYKPRLLHIKGRRQIFCEQVPLDAASLNSGDVFVLDAGLHVYVWQGASSNGAERLKGEEIARSIRDERERGVQVHIFGERDSSDSSMADFWRILGGQKPIQSAAAGGADDAVRQDKKLFRLSDAGGSLTFTEVASGRISRSLLNGNDVFILDSGFEIFVWVGQGASVDERLKALPHAQQYLTGHGRPPYLPITRCYQGGENETFFAAFDN